MKSIITCLFLFFVLPCFQVNSQTAIKYVGLKQVAKYNGFSSIDSVDYEKTYYISDYLHATPINARSFCKSYGKTMDLLALEREEFPKVQSKLSPFIDDIVIVGGFLHNVNRKSEYYWISTGTKIDLSYDASRGNNCIGLQKVRNGANLSYIGIPCNVERKFICQDVEYQYAN